MINDKQLRALHSVYQAQKTQKAHKAIEQVTAMLLDLALECYGPIEGQNPQATSHANGLQWYAERQPEFAALLFTVGLGPELGLPMPDPQHAATWAKVKATASRTTRKSAR